MQPFENPCQTFADKSHPLFTLIGGLLVEKCWVGPNVSCGFTMNKARYEMPLKPGANPYNILGLQKGCTDKEIQKAYRAQCLKWHPDKNLDNKEEAERRFIEAKEAFDFLYDKEKRADYDKSAEKVRVAEEKQRQRMEKADSHRKKLIEELEKREKDFNTGKRSSTSDGGAVPFPHESKKRKTHENNIREEMEAIRKQLEKEANEEVKRQMEMMKSARSEHKRNIEKATGKLLVKWIVNSGKDYTENDLRELFKNFGAIANVSPIISRKEKRKVIVEFAPGVNAWGAELETGSEPKPELTGEWIEPPVRIEKTEKPEKPSNTGNNFEHMSLEDLEAQIMGGM
uniref:J domain-containing protein n=1 Tax=Caenorhabditis japonica TaxID=281687 RepID=A0A8R1E291_CAEJA